jgi:hypothetical protein
MKETTAALNTGVLLGKMPFELGDYVNGVLDEGCPPSNATIVMLQVTHFEGRVVCSAKHSRTPETPFPTLVAPQNLTRTAEQQRRRLLYECHFEQCKQYDCLNDSAAAFLVGAGPDQVGATDVCDEVGIVTRGADGITPRSCDSTLDLAAGRKRRGKRLPTTGYVKWLVSLFSLAKRGSAPAEPFGVPQTVSHVLFCATVCLARRFPSCLSPSSGRHRVMARTT